MQAKVSNIRTNILLRNAVTWGLGLGLTVLLCLTGAAAVRLHASALLSTFVISAIAVLTIGGSLAFLTFVCNHSCISVEGSSSTATAVSAMLAALTLLTLSFVMSLIMPVLVLFLLSSAQSDHRQGKTLRQSKDNFFGHIVPQRFSFG
ncbi:hypothetical protein CCAX7_54390 [Capsulimonas corticalis]|uniref:Uncharacterized protein n=1 Tax=Capsulimonas corticalis TaxID=2219043 RepID=A0A402D5U7_9BACT|nr:hypothetical protein [Capsulimonas corticalis]BDI33388.1 hypothetical protein CCAX7_54390 [Capsulimonas corticalis]